ncbi:uncharacterized protein LOC124284972 [Haliotis rubra]|uniref:uncharacterized protein LOC124284972 n=1 Tax=Haliotis rubra TaxID=36100 RepID=UPI001EE5D22B|nr:uncharacterized protein LOC124284972 [Haliotis rubra]
MARGVTFGELLPNGADYVETTATSAIDLQLEQSERRRRRRRRQMWVQNWLTTMARQEHCQYYHLVQRLKQDNPNQFKKYRRMPVELFDERALDGKNIKIRAPALSGSDYWCDDKSCYAIVLLALVDYNYKFLWVDTGGLGHQSDAHIFSAFHLKDRLETGTLGLPPPETIEQAAAGAGGQQRRTFVMKPWSKKYMTKEELNYRIMANRWRRLMTVFYQAPEVAQTTTECYIVLHNLTRLKYPATLRAHYGSFKSNINYEEMAINTLEGIWNCSFENVDLDTLTQFHMQESNTTKEHHKCIKKNPGVNGIVTCLPHLKELCQSKRINSQKVVRLPLRLVSPLMKKYPDLKILHLVRDPRASIISQYVKLKYFPWNQLQKYTETFCARVHEDLQTTAKIARDYPGRIKLVRYETMAEHPLEITDELYQFVDAKITKELHKYVYDRTLSGKKDTNCVTCLVKSNASVAANKWRTSIGLRAAQAIDAKCGKVYTLLGYKPVKTVLDLKNLTGSLKISDIKFAGMTV